ncbi:rod shape-determining protein MreD [Ligilactobacillus equi]|uniref:Rod shape-determining protein n=2 Tax=Ligilactobacillus equi TaxID=137357 RepID=V7HYH6_9LACO|nr:rod shape-determining protein MreD [Ligilactobacillus equi]ETA74917.1 rod shape-determining protein [Ligilactobacillus equi DPC 6820]KRL85289.1 rod shape-determining protein [Ligilactobacillus equi DSM 15833 = JCM 10991]MCQ2556404.1 rod shape-determining protein MreD [Ligilactobacillus sp.]
MKLKMSYVFPLGLFLALFLDGSLSYVASDTLFNTQVEIESRFILLWLVLAICFVPDLAHPYFWATFAGLVFDSYYTSILGIMTVILPLVVYLTKETMAFFKTSFWVVCLMYFIDVTVVSLGFYLFNNLIGFTAGSQADYILKVLWPTLTYNMVCFLFLYWPLKELFTRVK